MFGMSGTELAIVLVLALLLLGPSKLPELARSLGKAVRDFKRATGDIRTTVESEFYRMDQDPMAELPKAPAVPTPSKAQGIVTSGGAELPPASAPGRLPDVYAQAEAEKAAASATATASATPEDKAQQLEKELAAPPAPAAPTDAAALPPATPEPKS
ncbi:MAG TPA: twin-arginine translocase TatA/TatE family subunit [Myxococcales bacterium]|jgi:sec-independent protein translocase protein TatB